MKLSAQHMTGEDQRPKPASIAARFGGWAARRMRVGFLGLLLPAAIALPLGIMAGGAWITWQSVWRSAEAELASTADAAAEYAQRVLEGHRLRAALVDQLLDGRSDAEIRSREAELHRNLRALIEQHQPDGAPPPILVVYGREGRPLLSSTIYPVVPADYTDREFFRVMAAPGAPPVHVGEVVEGRASQRPLFPLSVRREATGAKRPARSDRQRAAARVCRRDQCRDPARGGSGRSSAPRQQARRCDLARAGGRSASRQHAPARRRLAPATAA